MSRREPRSDRGPSRGYGGDFGPSAYAGMRSDSEPGRWQDFAGEDGWFGAGFAGYPGVAPSERAIQRGIDDRFPRSSSEPRELRASDLMTRDPASVTPDAMLTEAARIMRDLDVGVVPVVQSARDRRLLGVVTDRDLIVRVVAEDRDPNHTPVSECMTSEVQSGSPDDPVRALLHLMEFAQVRRVPITDDDGRLVGIVAQADLAVHLDETREGAHRVAHALERISAPTPATPWRNPADGHR